MAARRPGRDRRRVGHRRPGDARARQSRRLHGARLRRPRRASLGPRRARRDLRPDAGRDRGAPRPRRAGGGGLPEPRPRRGHGRRRRRRAGRDAGRRRHGGNDWLCQFLADILEVPVERPANLETTALGAAFHAGLATGYGRTSTRCRGPGCRPSGSSRKWTTVLRRELLAAGEKSGPRARGPWGPREPPNLTWAAPPVGAASVSSRPSDHSSRRGRRPGHEDSQ